MSGTSTSTKSSPTSKSTEPMEPTPSISTRTTTQSSNTYPNPHPTGPRHKLQHLDAVHRHLNLIGERDVIEFLVLDSTHSCHRLRIRLLPRRLALLGSLVSIGLEPHQGIHQTPSVARISKRPLSLPTSQPVPWSSQCHGRS
eukprot:TRINITY_DN6207_c0_g2_i5.p1 TRINITY_DN6207_c0_g2~~TRINITY_DN6207_c0_g2_i5.p1  ORF type:complete len:142 (-),score=16.49 TRINITY_DN6207_c0_g2_i5:148-573(-)